MTVPRPSLAGCSPSSSAPRCSQQLVIGSRIAAGTLSPNDIGLALLQNATAAGLFAAAAIFATSPDAAAS
jgi:hypothetical protein